MGLNQSVSSGPYEMVSSVLGGIVFCESAEPRLAFEPGSRTLIRPLTMATKLMDDESFERRYDTLGVGE
jgi:hypothetical protein